MGKKRTMIYGIASTKTPVTTIMSIIGFCSMPRALNDWCSMKNCAFWRALRKMGYGSLTVDGGLWGVPWT